MRNDRGYTYLITNGIHYEIGVTTDTPEKRIVELQTNSPTKVIISAYCYNTNALAMERELHKKFSSKKLQGGWFALNDDDVAIIHNHFANNYLDECFAPLREKGIEALKREHEERKKREIKEHEELEERKKHEELEIRKYKERERKKYKEREKHRKHKEADAKTKKRGKVFLTIGGIGLAIGLAIKLELLILISTLIIIIGIFVIYLVKKRKIARRNKYKRRKQIRKK